MLLEEFDENKIALLNPNMSQKKIKDFPKTAIGFFSKTVMKEFVNTFNPKIVYSVQNSTMVVNLYQIIFQNTPIIVFHSPMGASACVGIFEQIQELGIENFLYTGMCGCLVNDIKQQSIIIPTLSLRDEGTSYHYQKPSDEIELDKNVVTILEDTIKNLNLSYTKGKTWSTDAIFRETIEKVNKRKSQGAIVVDMECSALCAVSKFRNKRFGQIFYVEDNLSNDKYDPRELFTGSSIDKKSFIIPIMLQCAVNLDKKYNK
ncbi:MAG: nucleoside phosphorylase [Clostridia bacterium]|nr:nucleoside phosphorylase [Clostridia bacterium]